MQTTQEPPARTEAHAPRPESGPGGAGRRPSLQFRNWSVGAKLLAIVILPLVAAVVATAVLTQNLRATANDLGLDADLAVAQQATLDVVEALQQEQLVVAAGVAELDGGALELRTRSDQQAVTDATVRRMQDLVSGLQDRFPTILDPAQSANSAVLRVESFRNSFATSANATSVIPVGQTYDAAANNVLGLSTALTELIADRTLRSAGVATRALSDVNRLGVFEDVLLVGAATDAGGPATNALLTGVDTARADALRSFRIAANVDVQQEFNNTNNAAERVRRNRYALEQASTTATLATPAEYLSVTVDAERTTEALRSRLSGELVDRADAQRQAALNRANWLTILVIALLLLGLAFTIFAIRAVTRSLAALRDGALDIAGTKLPAAIARIRDGGRNPSLDVEPVDVHTTEETGQVARAFDAVHQEAVRLAGEQEELRRNVNDILVNLSRRSQALVGRQLSLIDRLENQEQDPDQLSQLFRLDHLASRMRRNNDNLMVLAGSGGAQSGRPLPVVDVVRAAVSETEAYTRITVQAVPPATVSAAAANDLVHLLAELLDNATTFSPPSTKVTVAVRRDFGAGLVIEVADNGVGIGVVELAELNGKLEQPPIVDSDVPRQMGLFVVSRLARRHDMKVILSPAASGSGLVASVEVPTSVLAAASAAPAGRTGAGSSATEARREHGQHPANRNGWSAAAPPTHPSTTNGNGSHRPAPAPSDPPVRSARPAPPPEEMTPIFQELSAWFSGRDDLVGPALPERPAEPVAAAPPVARTALDRPEEEPDPAGEEVRRPAFVSGADEGWRAVLAVEREVVEEVTAVGLPRRRPRANLVPGSALPTRTAETPAGKHRDAEAVRGRLSSYQRGLQSGRSDTRGAGARGPGPGGPAPKESTSSGAAPTAGTNAGPNGAGSNGAGSNGAGSRAAGANGARPKAPTQQPGGALPRRQPRPAPEVER